MDRLKNNDVIVFAERAAKKLGMELPSKAWMLRYLEAKLPIPILVENETAQLWIDPFYIAYSHDSEREIHYPYLTEYHIEEEHASYLWGLQHRRIEKGLPEPIAQAFETARGTMRRTGRTFIADMDFFRRA